MCVNDFFFCYDKKVMKYLRYTKGIGFITNALHPNTKLEFWLFEKTSELQEALNEISDK